MSSVMNELSREIEQAEAGTELSGVWLNAMIIGTINQANTGKSGE